MGFSPNFSFLFLILSLPFKMSLFAQEEFSFGLKPLETSNKNNLLHELPPALDGGDQRWHTWALAQASCSSFLILFLSLKGSVLGLKPDRFFQFIHGLKPVAIQTRGHELPPALAGGDQKWHTWALAQTLVLYFSFYFFPLKGPFLL